MREWLRIAREPPVVQRALRSALIVGTVLTAINHGDEIVRGMVNLELLFKVVLTALVPYFVSTFSSVAAIRQFRDV